MSPQKVNQQTITQITEDWETGHPTVEQVAFEDLDPVTVARMAAQGNKAAVEWLNQHEDLLREDHGA